jgi:hypothetical protein
MGTTTVKVVIVNADSGCELASASAPAAPYIISDTEDRCGRSALARCILVNAISIGESRAAPYIAGGSNYPACTCNL